MNKELDHELIELQNEYKELDIRYGEIEAEIEELENDRDRVESQMNDIEKQIDHIKKEMMCVKIDALDIETDNKFTLDFIKASYFTARYNDARPVFQTVNITENELQACNGYKAIRIKNNEIPMELQNTKILWDVREKFEENINKVEGDFIKLSNIFPDPKDMKYKIEGINSEMFYEFFSAKEYGTNGTFKLFYEDFMIAFNKELLNDALIALKGTTFTVSFMTSVSPVILESGDIQVLVLPVRLLNSEG